MAKQWTARRRDGGRVPRSEELGDERLDLLLKAGMIVGYEKAPSYQLLGPNGGKIGVYTPDRLVHLTERKGTVAVEWKGRESRDFRLRALLFQDMYCKPHGNLVRLDIVPVLERKELQDLALNKSDYYQLIHNYDPETWPEYWVTIEAALKQASAQRGAWTRRLNRIRKEAEG